MKKVITYLLLAALLTGAAACGESPVPVSSDTSAADTTPVETESDYDYPTADFGGHEFLFLSLVETSWANALIAPEETNGDLVNDAMFERNARVGERYNITIKEDKREMADIANVLKQTVTAGDDVYDVCMLPLHSAGGILADNYVVDLSTVDALRLDEAWWDQSTRTAAELNGHIYMMTSDISFFPFEATWAIFFNEGMVEDLGMALPYDLVREGKWTYDKLVEYAKAGALLNGAENFAFSEDGKARYGFCSHHDFPLALIFGAGHSFAAVEDGTPVFTADTEIMFDLYDRIAALTGLEGAYYNWDFSVTTSNIAGNFMNGRFMMCSETLGYLSTLRSMEKTFGVLPIPKYDEKQESYHSIIASWGTTMTTIPVSCSDYERSGIVLDALAYDSYKNLMEPYYDAYLMQKGVRNDDSAEMLTIIRATRSIAADVAFGWTSSLHDTIKAELKLGNSDIASIIASNKEKSLAAIEKTLSQMQ